MPDLLYVKVTGDEELVRRFSTVGDTIRQRIKIAMLAGALDLAETARELAPKASGRLRESVRPSASGVAEVGNSLSITVRPWGNRPDAGRGVGNFAIGLFAEIGLSEKRIWNRSIGDVISQRISFKGGKVRHGRKQREVSGGWYRKRPDIAAHPFMGPAIASNRERMLERVSDAVEQSFREIG